jgi:hypothetical protein
MSTLAERIVTIYIGNISVEVGKQMWTTGSPLYDMKHFSQSKGKSATLFVKNNNVSNVMNDIIPIIEDVNTLDGFILIGDFDNDLFGEILSALKEEYQHVSFLTINIDPEATRVFKVDRHNRTIFNISNINNNSDASILLRLDTTIKQVSLPKNTTRLNDFILFSKLSNILQYFIYDTFKSNSLQEFVTAFSSNGPKWGSIGVHDSDDTKIDEEKRKIYAYESSCLDFPLAEQKYTTYIKNNNMTLCVSNNSAMKRFFEKLNFNNELDKVLDEYNLN